MEIRQLHNHLRTLIEIEETENPVVSYFLDVQARDGARTMRERVAAARRALERADRSAFDRAVDRIEDHVPWKLDSSTRSVAVFARSGSAGPLFLVLEFEAVLPTRLFVESTPVVFPLVELLDNFHRYVLLVCSEDSARVLEVSLGSVTREVWTHRPELRKRVGREWTKLHYQNHRRDRADRFVKEKIGLVERVMASGGHTHLMLAGNPQVLARVRKALPKSLESKLVDVIPASSRDRSTDVVLATLSSFLEHEEQESLAAVGALRRELRTGGLAVAGHRACRDALLNGQADLLVMLADRDEQDTGPREELTRLALEHDVHVEVVQHSEELEELGGVGCLLRYEIFDHPTEEADQAA